MTNSEIVEKLEDAVACMELLEYNVFKVNAFRNLSQHIEKLPSQLSSMNEEQLAGHFSKSMHGVLSQLLATETFAELGQMEEQIPKGVRSMLNINGLGPKKVRVIWKDAGIETLEMLEDFCRSGKLSLLKGFGDKVQQSILDGLGFLQSAEGKWLMHHGEALAKILKVEMETFGIEGIQEAGDLVTKAEVVSAIDFLLPLSQKEKVKKWLEIRPGILWQKAESGPFCLSALFMKNGGKIRFYFAGGDEMARTGYLLNASPGHWSEAAKQQIPLYSVWLKGDYKADGQLFQLLGKSEVPPDLRTGHLEWKEEFASEKDRLIKAEDIRGCLHNHSNYSDGKNTIEEMALRCVERGWQYFGIADHSKSAQYANGLFEERVEAQWKEIDALNAKMAPFRILKGIESDILPDGRLDYDAAILSGFDYVVASVHSAMKMDRDTATQRLIRAIENPYTSILGHCSGRILLRRPGYPLHYNKIIDACIANGVVIEINAHPSRLDMDYENLAGALEKGAMISINPDAHDRDGMDMIKYGVWMARKAGARTERVLNALSLENVISVLKKKIPVLPR